MRAWIVGGMPALALVAAGCGSPSIGTDTSLAGGSDACGDPDGSGGDTGDVPNILGKWTATFGQYVYDSAACTVEGLQQDDMTWLNGAMDIAGRIPDQLYAYFDGDDSERFFGLEASTGGVVFSGTHEQDGHTLYTSFGGLLYQVPQVERNEIRGFGYIGVDIDSADGAIDCWIQGDFIAKKSGS